MMYIINYATNISGNHSVIPSYLKQQNEILCDENLNKKWDTTICLKSSKIQQIYEKIENAFEDFKKSITNKIKNTRDKTKEKFNQVEQKLHNTKEFAKEKTQNITNRTRKMKHQINELYSILYDVVTNVRSSEQPLLQTLKDVVPGMKDMTNKSLLLFVIKNIGIITPCIGAAVTAVEFFFSSKIIFFASLVMFVVFLQIGLDIIVGDAKFNQKNIKIPEEKIIEILEEYIPSNRQYIEMTTKNENNTYNFNHLDKNYNHIDENYNQL